MTDAIGTLAPPEHLARETAVALAAAREAGEIAAGLQAGVERTLKSDGSPVTPADLAADAVLRAHLQLHFPDDAILSEEGARDPRRATATRVWIIDPIDGTSEFVKGSQEWAVQVALSIDGELRLGIVAIPREGVVLVGLPGIGGTILTRAGARPLLLARGRANVLIGSSSSRNRAALAQLQAALPEFTVVHATSVGIKVWRLIQGQADLYLHPRRIAEWDAAAPAAVLAAAGGTATDFAGRPFHFNQLTPELPGLFCTVRPDAAALVARLAAAGLRVA